VRVRLRAGEELELTLDQKTFLPSTKETNVTVLLLLRKAVTPKNAQVIDYFKPSPQKSFSTNTL